jgi:hypothetical protein
MDKDFIMKLDDEKDLLDKEKTILGLARHPIPFPTYRTVLSDRTHFMQVVYDCLKDYTDRFFIVTCDNYGIEVSINYEDGLFKSMILKGSGKEGERIREDVALLLVPPEAKNKNKVTLHGLLTILDHRKFRGGMEKHEVPRVLKQALMQGIIPREGKEVVCRPYTLFIDGERQPIENLWEEIGGFLISGLSFYGEYDAVEEIIKEDIMDDHTWLIPHRGFIIDDNEPWDEKAFSPIHFIIDDFTTP